MFPYLEVVNWLTTDPLFALPPRKVRLLPPTGTRREPTDLQWNLYTNTDEYFNLALMARTLDNALTLRSDFMVSPCHVTTHIVIPLSCDPCTEPPEWEFYV